MPNLREPGVESDQSEYWLDLRRSSQQFVSRRVEREAVGDIVSGVILKLVTKRPDILATTMLDLGLDSPSDGITNNLSKRINFPRSMELGRGLALGRDACVDERLDVTGRRMTMS